MDKAYFEQVLCSGVIGFGVFGLCMTFGFPSPSIPSMLSDSSLNITQEDASWIASIIPGVAIIGSLLSGPLMEAVGRKKSLLLTTIPTIISWIIIATAESFTVIMIGRTLSGLLTGLQRVTFSVYFAETVPQINRSALSIVPTVLGTVALSFVNVLGKFFDWRGIAVIGALSCLPLLILLMLRPETPFYLVKKGESDAALKVLNQLRANSSEAEKELEELKMSLKMIKSGSSLKKMVTPPFLWPFSVGLVLHISQQFLGLSVIMSSSSVVFQNSGSKYDPITSSVVLMSVNVIAAFVGPYVLTRYKRKVVLKYCTIMVAQPLLLLSAFIFIQNSHKVFQESFFTNVLPIVCLCIYIAGSSCGWATIPWGYIGEGIPSDIRGVSAGVLGSVNWLCAFITTKSFGWLLQGVGMPGVLLIYASSAIVGNSLLQRYMPETFGRRPGEMDKMYMEVHMKSKKKQ